MGWFGNWFGATEGSGGGSPPVIITNNVTTAELIRDHVIALIEGLAPRILEADRFRVSRDEREADFIAACESDPRGAFRRVHVRDTGASSPPDIANCDVKTDFVTIRVLIAYPQNGRTARDNAGARDRDDTAREDAQQIDYEIGLEGYRNFTGSSVPNASWIDGGIDARVEGQGVDFGSLTITYRYYRRSAPP